MRRAGHKTWEKVLLPGCAFRTSAARHQQRAQGGRAQTRPRPSSERRQRCWRHARDGGKARQRAQRSQREARKVRTRLGPGSNAQAAVLEA
jgi:hypothetical protein